MLAFAFWYLVLLLVGVFSFPIAFRLFPRLTDGGYAFSRILGLLIWGYSYWLLGSLGVLGNDLGSLWFALGTLLALAVWAGRSVEPGAFRNWWLSQGRTVLVVEVLFLLTFGGWSLVRAANPEIFATEKPMELAFINAILRSPALPPNDPWLSGYAISYYYFGYLMTAMLARFTGITSGVAFNLAVSMVFALSAVGAYGVLYNLLEGGRSSSVAEEGPNSADHAHDQRKSSSASARLFALLGPLYVLILGNLEGFLEVIHARGLFWAKDASGNPVSSFWRWLDIRELTNPPSDPVSWLPRNYNTGSWWWWQASRVVQDYDLSGGWKEVIDEFPFFSFLLADLHPHVLAIPFAFLAMGLALNLFLGGAAGQLRFPIWPWPFTVRFRVFGRDLQFEAGRTSLRFQLSALAFLFAALTTGGLAFLNTWDFPMYVGLIAGAYLLVRARQVGWSWERFKEFGALGIALGVAGVLLYIPFYIGFSSQAGGILPNLIYPTRGAHLWVMFGIFFLPLFAFLIVLFRKDRAFPRLKYGLYAALGLTVALWIFSLLLGLGIVSLPVVGDIYLDSLGATGRQSEVFVEAFRRRILSPGAWVTLIAILTLVLGLLWPRSMSSAEQSPEGRYTLRPSHQFVLLLILLSTLLLFVPEFIYLRDQFGWRINTIFKFYYQAWLLLGIAVAYATRELFGAFRRTGRFLSSVALMVLLGLGLIYPLLSLIDKTHGFSPPQGWTLDGTVHSNYLGPEDVAALRWLGKAPLGILAEAVGGSYTQYGRISAHSGLPSVLGWPGHESQWRGGAREMGSRQQDIDLLYSTRDWVQAARILREYDIRYVYLGPLERSTYAVSEGKFQRFLEPVFEEGAVTIYEVPTVLQ